MHSNYFTPDNVLVVTFGEDPENDKNAYQALTDLKQLDSQNQIKIAGAAVVTREPNGLMDAKSEVGEDHYGGTASGGMIGLLVGIIRGPLGVLLGGATGVLVGSLFDIDEVETTESVLSEISKQVQPTRTAVLAQVTEQSPDVIDAAMARLGGEVMRRPVVHVEDEIAAAQEAQRTAKREARKELHKARVEQTKQDAHAKVEGLIGRGSGDWFQGVGAELSQCVEATAGELPPPSAHGKARKRGLSSFIVDAPPSMAVAPGSERAAACGGRSYPLAPALGRWSFDFCSASPPFPDDTPSSRQLLQLSRLSPTGGGPPKTERPESFLAERPIDPSPRRPPRRAPR